MVQIGIVEIFLLKDALNMVKRQKVQIMASKMERGERERAREKHKGCGTKLQELHPLDTHQAPRVCCVCLWRDVTQRKHVTSLSLNT